MARRVGKIAYRVVAVLARRLSDFAHASPSPNKHAWAKSLNARAQISLPRQAILPTLLLALVLPLTTHAQDLPARPIRIIVPNPPGGAGDISARLIGQKLSESLHQPVVVENQAGASGALGMNMLKRAAPDGTTIGVAIALAQTIDLIQNKQASFDIVRDFTPITAIADNPAGLVVNSQIAATSLPDLIDLARKRPGEISYGSAGIGTGLHLYGQVLNQTAGIAMLNVPYKGTTPALNDLIGGHVPAAILSLATALPHIQSGRLRLLTVFDTKRYAKLPDVPAVSEVLPGFVPGRAWIGFLGPRDLPAAITTRLHEELVRVINSPDVQQVLGENGLVTIANTPAEFAAMIREDAKIWDAAAVSAGLVAR
jgi:tripartite-type tricarboxylate transporter receptor subunit TctC